MIPAAVIFDLDGTLFDHPQSVVGGLRAWLPTLGYELTDELLTAWHAAEGVHFQAWLDGKETYEEHARGRLRQFLPLIDHPVDDDAQLDALFRQGYLLAYQAAWCGYEDTVPALQDLRAAGISTGVLTNGRTIQQTRKVAALGLSDLLGPLLAADELGIAKPHPGAFRAACERLDVEPHETIYVGDNHVVDVLGARAAGLKAVYLDRTNLGPLDDPARVTTLSKFSEVVDML